jgi:hypothetical protein
MRVREPSKPSAPGCSRLGRAHLRGPASIAVLVKHPTLGKCPWIPNPYLPPDRTIRTLAWEVTGDLVLLVINQYGPKQTSL